MISDDNLDKKEMRSNESFNGCAEGEVRRSERVRKKPKFLEEFVLSVSYCLMDPTSYQEAIKSKDNERWLKAMESEIQSLNKANTWKLVKRRNIVKF